METSKGHIKKIEKENPKNPSDPQQQDEEPVEQLEHKTNSVITNIVNPQQHIVIELTGSFPVTSKRGNEYLLYLYNHYSNSILVRTMKSRTNNNFLRVFQDLHGHLSIQGLKPS